MDGSKASAEATVEEVKALGGDAIACRAGSTLYYIACYVMYSRYCIYRYIYMLDHSLISFALVSPNLSSQSHYTASDPVAIKAMFDQVVEKYGTVDVLINNAGITRDTLVVRMKPEMWQAVIDTNLSGVFYCTQAFFKVRGRQGWCHCLDQGQRQGVFDSWYYRQLHLPGFYRHGHDGRTRSRVLEKGL
jgi:NAD(P)-dependent dehydrogenase (short-subunit alcohol dehydrogenase family)